jgi:hypothetical protein
LVLIDGHNVLHALRAARLRGNARVLRDHASKGTLHGLSHAEEIVELAAHIVRAKAFGKQSVVIVCDGSPPRGIAQAWPRANEGADASRVRLHFSGDGIEADDALRDLLMHTQKPREMTVVSNDRAVVRDATTVRAKTMSALELVAKLSRHAIETHTDDELRSAPAIDTWMKYFEQPREPLTKRERKTSQQGIGTSSERAGSSLTRTDNHDAPSTPQRIRATRDVAARRSSSAALPGAEAVDLASIDMEAILRLPLRETSKKRKR